MTQIGYTTMCEQPGPKHLVRDAALAEQTGFDAELPVPASFDAAARALGSHRTTPRSPGLMTRSSCQPSATNARRDVRR